MDLITQRGRDLTSQGVPGASPGPGARQLGQAQTLEGSRAPASPRGEGRLPGRDPAGQAPGSRGGPHAEARPGCREPAARLTPALRGWRPTVGAAVQPPSSSIGDICLKKWGGAAG